MRRRRAQAALLDEGGAFPARSEHGQFRAGAGADPSRCYTVTRAGGALACACRDRVMRGSACPRIMRAEAASRGRMLFGNGECLIPEPAGRRACPRCLSGEISMDGVRACLRGTVQKYKCGACRKKLPGNAGFEGARAPRRATARALDMSGAGMSLRDISRSPGMSGAGAAPSTVYGWIRRHSGLIVRHAGGMIPRTGDRPVVRADGTRLRIRGSMKHTFSSIDNGTRFLTAYGAAGSKNRRDAGPLLRKAMRRMGRAPRHFMTDGLAAYARPCRRVFGGRTEHHVFNHMRGDRSNNRTGRFNGTLRDREAAWRGLKRADSPMIDCFAVCYNFVRPHSALGGRTPAEAACIRVEGDDRRLALIRNAGADPLRE